MDSRWTGLDWTGLDLEPAGLDGSQNVSFKGKFVVLFLVFAHWCLWVEQANVNSQIKSSLDYK